MRFDLVRIYLLLLVLNKILKIKNLLIKNENCSTLCKIPCKMPVVVELLSNVLVIKLLLKNGF